MELGNITEKNWKQLAPKLAKIRFPIDSLVEFSTWRKNFGKVKQYTPTGMVVIIPGELNEVNRELIGAYWEIDYNPVTFKFQLYGASTRNPKSILRFTPFYSEIGGKSEINWHRIGAGILSPLVLDDKGLVNDTQLNY